MTSISHSETKSCLLWETDILEEKSKLWSTQNHLFVQLHEQ